MKCIAVLFSCLVTAVAERYTGSTNRAGLNLIEEFEGFYPNFYKDPVGVRKVGYGHACHIWSCSVPINGKYPVPFTRTSAEALLKEDLAFPGRYEDCVNNHVKYPPLNANQYSALVSFTFNLGCRRFKSSTLLTLINRGDVVGAANEFSKWIYAGGRVRLELVKRRAAEKALFCEGGGCEDVSGYRATFDSCVAVVTSDTRLNVRSGPKTDSAIVGTLSKGTSVSIVGRVNGTNVYGNPNWLWISYGYISAYWVSISGGNGAEWCAIY